MDDEHCQKWLHTQFDNLNSDRRELDKFAWQLPIATYGASGVIAVLFSRSAMVPSKAAVAFGAVALLSWSALFQLQRFHERRAFKTKQLRTIIDRVCGEHVSLPQSAFYPGSSAQMDHFARTGNWSSRAFGQRSSTAIGFVLIAFLFIGSVAGAWLMLIRSGVPLIAALSLTMAVLAGLPFAARMHHGFIREPTSARADRVQVEYESKTESAASAELGVDVVKFWHDANYAELSYRRKREFQIFSFTAALLIAVVGTLIMTPRSDFDRAQIGVEAATIGAWGLVLLAAFSVWWQLHEWRFAAAHQSQLSTIWFEPGSGPSTIVGQGWMPSELRSWRAGMPTLAGVLLHPNKITATVTLGIAAILTLCWRLDVSVIMRTACAVALPVLCFIVTVSSLQRTPGKAESMAEVPRNVGSSAAAEPPTTT